MKKLFILLIFLLIPASVSALEFTENTTFNSNNINYHFNEGISVDNFQVVSDGLLINDNHKFVFIVEGGELDVTFYEWTPTNNLIGLKGAATQDLVFKITVDNQKKYLLSDNEYYINEIEIGIEEINVSYVKYFETETTTVIKTIKPDKWHQSKFAEFEYNVEKDNNGIIHSETFSISYLFLILFILTLIILGWLIR